MSDNVPFDIQAEIIKRLPIKSVIRFRSVCKAWKSLIDSSTFAAHYSGQQNILLRYAVGTNMNYVSYVDDETFPQQKVSQTLPPAVSMFDNFYISGNSHGLFCLSCGYIGSRNQTAVLWNPSIRKAIAVVVPTPKYGMYAFSLGFGVCRETATPKIVKIAHIDDYKYIERVSCIPGQVEVFTLSTGVWRSPYKNLPRKSLEFSCSVKEVIGGFLYWLAADRMIVDGEYRNHKLIVSFDLKSEEFREINLPYSIACGSSSDVCRVFDNVYMYKLKESLVVVDQRVTEGVEMGFVVWMMEDGVSKSFTKLYTVDIQCTLVKGFRKSGELILEVHDPPQIKRDSHKPLSAEYDAYTKQIKIIEPEISYRSSAYPYKETLLLVDQPVFITYDNGSNRYVQNQG